MNENLDPAALRAARAVFERMRGRLPEGSDDQEAVQVLARLIDKEAGISQLARSVELLKGLLEEARTAPVETVRQQILMDAEPEIATAAELLVAHAGHPKERALQLS